MGHLHWQISPQIFEKIPNDTNVIFRDLGEDDSLKNLKQKISWHCPLQYGAKKQLVKLCLPFLATTHAEDSSELLVQLRMDPLHVRPQVAQRAHVRLDNHALRTTGKAEEF